LQLNAQQPREAVCQEAAFAEGVELVLHDCGKSAPDAASACANKVATCCSVVCSGR